MMPTMPTSISRAKRRAAPPSLVKTAAPFAEGVALTISMASVKRSQRNTQSTGPKISFCCFYFRAKAGVLRRRGECRYGGHCRYLHADPDHIRNLVHRYGLHCDREDEHGECRHRARKEHP